MTRSLQIAYPSDGVNTIKVELPSPTDEVLPGVKWGEAAGLFSPAYWAAHTHLFASVNRDISVPHRFGQSLIEETAACLLGGYGMPAELGLAAFHRLRDSGLLTAGVRAQTLEKELSKPFSIGNRSIRYRFPRQKARYVSECIDLLHDLDIPLDDAREVRDQLAKLPGLGPKTASWVVRNWLDSDDVAIVDVHITRALSLLNLVADVKLPREYQQIELVFIEFAHGLGVRASMLDAVMWRHMRRWGYLAIAASTHVSRVASRPRHQEYL